MHLTAAAARERRTAIRACYILSDTNALRLSPRSPFIDRREALSFARGGTSCKHSLIAACTLSGRLLEVRVYAFPFLDDGALRAVLRGHLGEEPRIWSYEDIAPTRSEHTKFAIPVPRRPVASDDR